MPKAIPESDFAVLKDTERQHIVDSGRFSEMSETADHFNRIYQSTAYVAERWKSQ